jgi:lipopolysaccharide transport system ATP-binding protein
MLSPLLKLSDISVYYAKRSGFFSNIKFWALKNLSLEVFRGETLGIIGHNGAGKTTLMQILAGIIAPNSGTYNNYGHRVSSLSLSVGFSKHLTGKENAIISGMLMGMDKSLILKRIDDIKEFSELGDFFDLPVNTYSTGMIARLGFSVAFQSDPDILLIDEILGVGDAAFKKKSSKVLRDRIRSNKTVVLVSHSSKMIEELCDRAILLEKGQKVMEGNPVNVLERYSKLIRQKPSIKSQPLVQAKAGGKLEAHSDLEPSISSDLDSPVPHGEQVKFIGMAIGGSGKYEFAFRLRNLSTGIAATVRDYSSDNHWRWDTNKYQKGAYLISVWVRNTGSQEQWEAWEQIGFSVQ